VGLICTFYKPYKFLLELGKCFKAGDKVFIIPPALKEFFEEGKESFFIGFLGVVFEEIDKCP
jgi:hypothetical protein